jgi:hypothetical protein
VKHHPAIASNTMLLTGYGLGDETLTCCTQPHCHCCLVHRVANHRHGPAYLCCSTASLPSRIDQAALSCNGGNACPAPRMLFSEASSFLNRRALIAQLAACDGGGGLQPCSAVAEKVLDQIPYLASDCILEVLIPGWESRQSRGGLVT